MSRKGAFGVKNPGKAAAFLAVFSLKSLISGQKSCTSPVFKQTLAVDEDRGKQPLLGKKTAFWIFQTSPKGKM
ncbi:MAG: hypothetical protein HFE94_04140 [Acutalibacter sp.]|nr:hypothetical protein [Acutalibacter sp.]